MVGEPCNLLQLQRNFKENNDIYQLMQFHTDTAKALKPPRQPFLYIDFTKDQMLTNWLTPESVGGLRKGLIEEHCLATELSTAPLVFLTYGIKATFGQTRFPKKK